VNRSSTAKIKAEKQIASGRNAVVGDIPNHSSKDQTPWMNSAESESTLWRVVGWNSGNSDEIMQLQHSENAQLLAGQLGLIGIVRINDVKNLAQCFRVFLPFSFFCFKN
jgi:hypothetical protein